MGKVKVVNKGGRPALPEAVWVRIIEAVAEGGTVKEAAGLEKVNPQTFRRAVLKSAELQKQWEMAKEFRAHRYFDEAVILTKQLQSEANSYGKESSATVRALDRAISAFFYAAARLSPREYGERQPANPPVAIQINTSLNLGQKGHLQVESPENIYKLSASPIDATFEPSGTPLRVKGEPSVLADPSPIEEPKHVA